MTNNFTVDTFTASIIGALQSDGGIDISLWTTATKCTSTILTKDEAIKLIVGIRSLLRQHPYVCANFDIGLTEDMIPTLSKEDLVEFRIKVLKSLLSIKPQKVRAELSRNTVWLSKLDIAAINNQVLLARLEQRLNNQGHE